MIEKEQTRLSNFEMLRIFAMALIIMHHFMNASDHKTDNVLFEFIAFLIMFAFVIYVFVFDYIRIYGVNRCLVKEGKRKT